MECDKIKSQLEDFLLGELEQLEPAYRAHIADCPQCSKKVSHWKAFESGLRNFSAPPPPPELAEEIILSVEARIENESQKAQAVLSFWPKMAWAAAAAFLIAMGGTWMLREKPQIVAAKIEKAGREVVFEGNFKGVAEVALVGDFNRWKSSNHLLKKLDGEKWRIKVLFPPGHYQYQFLVDGKVWMTDENNPIKISDGFGGFNSGIRI